MCADPSRKGRFHGSASGYGGGHDRNHAHLIVIVLLLALASMVVVPGAVLLAIPLVVILAFVLAAPAARGATASRGGTWVEDQEPSGAVGEALTLRNTWGREAVTASRQRTQE